jgi:hypothetical protein
LEPSSDASLRHEIEKYRGSRALFIIPQSQGFSLICVKLSRIGEGAENQPGGRPDCANVGGSKMAEEEFTGMYELLDALEAALKTADPAKRQALAKTSDAYHWAIGAQAPTLLYHLFMSIDAACRPDKQSKPRGVIRLADREPEGGNA